MFYGWSSLLKNSTLLVQVKKKKVDRGVKGNEDYLVGKFKRILLHIQVLRVVDPDHSHAS